MIYCVEDDDGIRNMMVYTLNASGLEAEGFSQGESFWPAVAAARPDLVLLDIMLPGEDGIAILRRLRLAADTATLPVMMTTAKGTEYDKVTGLDLGADDYLVKPFGMMEMVSRVKALLRRAGKAERPETVRFGELEMSLKERSLIAGGQRIELTLKEFELLRVFLENPGRVFTREQLLSRVWEMEYLGETRTVDVHVRHLRAKLGERGDLIETVRGVGYKAEAKG